MDTRKDVGIVFAVACELPAALIFISAIRIQFWDVIFDLSYERQIRYHRWIAWTLFYLIAIHSWVTFAFWVVRGSLFDEFKIKEIVRFRIRIQAKYTLLTFFQLSGIWSRRRTSDSGYCNHGDETLPPPSVGALQVDPFLIHTVFSLGSLA
jgi:hypothetical protein